ncbi:MAG: putative 2OG-Fe(II) oxygenase [Pikeienuella sp.]
MTQVVGLFPTPVMAVEGLAPADLLRALIEEARADATSRNAHDGRLEHSRVMRPEENPHFGKLAGLVAPHLREFGALLLGEKLDWAVKEIWTNRMDRGGRQEMHNHANSFISAVIYLTSTGESSPTVFYRAIGGSDYAFLNENKATRMTPFNARKWAAPAMRPGDAIFFPSYILHEVPPNPGAERMTVALNALPTRVDSWGYTVNFS